MKDFNITIDNVTANTDMIEEDVLRMNMGLKSNQSIEDIESNKMADEVFENLKNNYKSSAKEVEEMINQISDRAAKLLLIKIIRSADVD